MPKASKQQILRPASQPALLIPVYSECRTVRSAKAGGATPSRRCEWLPQAILRVASVSFAARPASVCGEVRLERSPRKKSSMLRTGEFFWLPSRSVRFGWHFRPLCACLLRLVATASPWSGCQVPGSFDGRLSRAGRRSPTCFGAVYCSLSSSFFSGTPRDKDASIPL